MTLHQVQVSDSETAYNATRPLGKQTLRFKNLAFHMFTHPRGRYYVRSQTSRELAPHHSVRTYTRAPPIPLLSI